MQSFLRNIPSILFDTAYAFDYSVEMLMHHHTLATNLEAIRKQGLLARKSRGKRKAVWVHTSALMGWACQHMLARRIGGVHKLVCLTVDVPKSWLIRHGKGVYYCMQDIPVERIVRVTGYALTTVEM